MHCKAWPSSFVRICKTVAESTLYLEQATQAVVWAQTGLCTWQHHAGAYITEDAPFANMSFCRTEVRCLSETSKTYNPSSVHGETQPSHPLRKGRRKKQKGFALYWECVAPALLRTSRPNPWGRGLQGAVLPHQSGCAENAQLNPAVYGQKIMGTVPFVEQQYELQVCPDVQTSPV